GMPAWRDGRVEQDAREVDARELSQAAVGDGQPGVDLDDAVVAWVVAEDEVDADKAAQSLDARDRPQRQPLGPLRAIDVDRDVASPVAQLVVDVVNGLNPRQ